MNEAKSLLDESKFDKHVQKESDRSVFIFLSCDTFYFQHVLNKIVFF